MKIVYSWLCEYLQASEGAEIPTAEALPELLTGLGLEVEEIERPGDKLKGVLVAEIRTAEPHPDSDHLQVCQVFDAVTMHQVVCGAPNARAGLRVAFASVGSVLPGGLTIGARKLRGVDSAGMLCSTKELELGEDQAGIWELPLDAPLGQPVAEAMGLDEVVFTLGVTPNRPDALSHFGVARDVAALCGLRLKTPESTLSSSETEATELASLSLEAPERCGRYLGRVVESFEQAASPEWMRTRLRLCGMRPISVVVDVTNYVLMELGHPLHAFDLDTLEKAQLRVRCAEAGEHFTTLDGVERVLDANDLMIADASHALALAGVMGGLSSEVTEGTKRLLIESAYFAPNGIRASAKRHGLHTEASHRFERGADPQGLEAALDRCAGLLCELAGAKVAKGRVEAQGLVPEVAELVLRAERIESVLGMPVPEERVTEILQRLGFELLSNKAGVSSWRAPSFRTEMGREIDLIEEVARVYGYDKIPALLPPQDAPQAPLAGFDSSGPRAGLVRQAMLAGDCFEVVNYSFLSPAALHSVVGEGELPLQRPITVTNPLSSDQSVMRTQLLQSLLENFDLNRRFLASRIRLFEIGRAYLRGKESLEEPRRLGVLLFGPREAPAWNASAESADLYDLKGLLEAATMLTGARPLEYRPCPAELSWLHPKRSAELVFEGRPIGWMGALHPRLSRARGLPEGIQVLEIDLEAWMATALPISEAKRLPVYPPLLRDLAIVVDRAVSAEQVRQLILKTAASTPPATGAKGRGVRLDQVTLFDVYEGEQVAEGQRSLAFSLRMVSDERTLTDAEADALQTALLAELQTSLGASLRS